MIRATPVEAWWRPDDKLHVTAKKAMVAPHTLAAEAVAALLEVRAESGLSAEQASERLSQTGPNLLPQAPARSPWRVLFAQFKSILILILLGAVVLAALVGSTKDALVILAVVVINALVGFFQHQLVQADDNIEGNSGLSYF